MDYLALTKLYYKDRAEYEAVYEQRYLGEETIHFNFEISGSAAFLVPTTEIMKSMISILKGNGLLMYLFAELPEEAMTRFEQKCLIEEIKMTNEIEGVASTRKEIEEAIGAIQSNSGEKKRLTGIINKYLLLQSGQGERELMTCQDIRDIYDELVFVEDVDDNPRHLPDGVYFRKDPVFVQKNQKAIHIGMTPEAKIIEYLDKGLHLINDSNLISLLSTAVFHYLFGYVHPFYDGNGRMARYLSSILLGKDVVFLVGYNLSNVIKDNLKSYYKAFDITNDKKNRGDLTPFVTTFFSLVDEAVARLIAELENAKNRYHHFKTMMECDPFRKASRAEKTLLDMMLINTLFGSRGMSVEEFAEKCNIADSSVRNSLRKMKREMLRIEKDGRKLLYDLDLNFIENILADSLTQCI